MEEALSRNVRPGWKIPLPFEHQKAKLSPALAVRVFLGSCLCVGAASSFLCLTKFCGPRYFNRIPPFTSRVIPSHPEQEGFPWAWTGLLLWFGAFTDFNPLGA